MENIAIKVENDDLTSSEFNQIVNELETAITSSNIVLSSLDQSQISSGVSRYVALQNYTIDSGSANSYTLSTTSPYKASPTYHDGMQIVFKPGNVNTGASTLNYNSLGSKSIYQNGTALIGGELSDVTVVQYDLAADAFEIISVRNELFFDSSKARIQPYMLQGSEYSSINKNASIETSAPSSIFFKPDGLKLYIVDSAITIYQYTLSKAWDVSTAAYDSVSFSVVTEDSSPTGIYIKPDGTKFYITGDANNTIYQYSMSTPWDLSTASYDTKSFIVATQETVPGGLSFKTDGAKMYVIGSSSDSVHQYTLSTPWDVSTATYDSVTLSVAAQDGLPTDLYISNDGKLLFFVGGTNDSVYKYAMPTAWDLSSASYVGDLVYVGAEDATPTGVFFGDTGYKMYMSGATTQTIYQYYSNLLST